MKLIIHPAKFGNFARLILNRMKTPAWLKQYNILKNQEEYGLKYNFLHFPDAQLAREMLDERDAIIRLLENRVTWTHKSTKADGSGLSEGCRICGEGTWSCLFINGICNSRCFYCPSPQHEVGEPETNSLIFPEPGTYVDYLKEFGFRGVSISGGEPLLTFEKSLSFIQTVRKPLGDAVYIWLYTNGKLFQECPAEKPNSCSPHRLGSTLQKRE
ncbi:MAG: 4Fe-4S cluster-binding domain-containing protein [Bacteroidales bacterium]|nr:4Fe-4S cluster-binding domain-containing protein [Bacteroidales bacterium]